MNRAQRKIIECSENCSVAEKRKSQRKLMFVEKFSSCFIIMESVFLVVCVCVCACTACATINALCFVCTCAVAICDESTEIIWWCRNVLCDLINNSTKVGELVNGRDIDWRQNWESGAISKWLINSEGKGKAITTTPIVWVFLFNNSTKFTKF